jgi:prophage antirepressor-like protein
MSLANYSSFVCDGAYDVDIVLKDGAPWFRACQVTKILGYRNGRDAVTKHVKEKYKLAKDALGATLEGGSKTLHPPHDLAVYISEPGLYSLIMRSKMQEAEEFQDWVVGTVLPAIRAQGSYQGKKPSGQQMCLMNEFDLHTKVVQFIRNYHSEAILVAGLGENQVTDKMRIDSYLKGYQRGQCDILILNKHKKYTGFALELKSPTGWGVLSQDQQKFLQGLRGAGYLTLVSNDYDEIIVKVGEYFRDIRIYCTHCGRWMSRKHSH